MSLLRSEAGLNCFIRSSAGLRLEAAEREEKERFIESGRTAGNRLPSPGKVKKAVSKPATDLENGSPPFRVKKGVGALRHKPYYSSNSVSSPPQGKEQSTHEQVLNSNGTRGSHAFALLSESFGERTVTNPMERILDLIQGTETQAVGG
ncbi:hypothetical protein GBA52_015466 [Prunus armeniaca]|nr:hypothetical protein GBA52_015466 [Prunus armeniaca]